MKGGSTTERKQFTFYRSFYEAVSRIRRKSVRADVYDAICRYGLNGERPDLETLAPEAAVAITLIMPVLETGKNKALNRIKTNENKREQTENKREQIDKEKDSEIESKKESDIESDIERKCEKDMPVGAGEQSAFEEFWSEYPKKVGKQAALKAFEKVTEPVECLLRAVKQQKQSEQWTRENGRFIPNPATWLGQQRWEDQLPPSGGVPKGASGVLGQAELENIQRMLKEG